MKPFQTLVGVRKPLPDIAAVIRDRLPEIAPALADVSHIEVTCREDREDGSTLLINEWRVDPKLPGPVRQAISDEMLGWNDHAVWTVDLTECTWRIEPFFMPGAIHCAGATRFEPAMGGHGTKAIFSGEFAVDASALAKIPPGLRGAAVSAVETIVGSMVPRNFRHTIEAAARLLD
ncbi:hypothetical protein [Aurantiacibacter poecillastricola]|uniref:hypothetical protein n=1 Tax=Aurantiacibacter poecillastricola TaxID=3064385 RepID=UPI00273F1440|nr:hypothetical protein [Aurantiacibacter sp. 219JJ12-13]MDP5261563.1 hypothetical protein [Aurantiacibacter sp. 219JJ12-13]